MNETIITLAELKAYLGIADDDTSQDAKLITLLAVLPDYLYDQTGVWFGSAKEITETQDYADVVFLDHIPVLAVTSIKRDYPGYEQVIDGATYKLNKNTGRLTLRERYGREGGNRRDYDELEIVYTTGITPVPASIKEAAKMFASGLYNAAANDGLEVSSEQIGSLRRTYKVSTREADLLSGYRVTNA